MMGVLRLSHCTTSLKGCGGEGVHPEEERRVFCQIWKFEAPSKVVAFFWELLLDRTLNRLNLAIRNILPLGECIICVCCERESETSTHLFLHCDMAKNT